MCNCAGVQFSNCVGNPDCDCKGAYTTYSSSSKTSNFNNAIGMNGFSNLTGEVQTISGPTIKLPSVTIPTVPTVQTTAPTTTKTSTIDKALTFGTSVLGLFGNKSNSSTTVTPAPLPEDENKIPTAVWVVVGGILLLVVAFIIVKAQK